jgi:hypothetical protein
VRGGPEYEVSYPNGDRAAYVTAVYEARIISGSLAPGGGELSEIAWFAPQELSALPLSRLARALLHSTGRLTVPLTQTALARPASLRVRSFLTHIDHGPGHQVRSKQQPWSGLTSKTRAWMAAREQPPPP